MEFGGINGRVWEFAVKQLQLLACPHWARPHWAHLEYVMSHTY